MVYFINVGRTETASIKSSNEANCASARPVGLRQKKGGKSLRIKTTTTNKQRARTIRLVWSMGMAAYPGGVAVQAILQICVTTLAYQDAACRQTIAVHKTTTLTLPSDLSGRYLAILGNHITRHGVGVGDGKGGGRSGHSNVAVVC